MRSRPRAICMKRCSAVRSAFAGDHSTDGPRDDGKPVLAARGGERAGLECNRSEAATFEGGGIVSYSAQFPAAGSAWGCQGAGNHERTAVGGENADGRELCDGLGAAGIEGPAGGCRFAALFPAPQFWDQEGAWSGRRAGRTVCGKRSSGDGGDRPAPVGREFGEAGGVSGGGTGFRGDDSGAGALAR